MMLRDDIINKCTEHKHALIFAAGIATAIVGKKILESETVKDAATKGMASVMSAKKDAEECFQDMKEKNVTKPLMKIRIHSSKKIIFGSVSYHEPTTSIYVHPANILLPSELALHRFHNIVVVLGAEPITTREWYTFLKSGTNISVADF